MKKIIAAHPHATPQQSPFQKLLNQAINADWERNENLLLITLTQLHKLNLTEDQKNQLIDRFGRH